MVGGELVIFGRYHAIATVPCRELAEEIARTLRDEGNETRITARRLTNASLPTGGTFDWGAQQPPLMIDEHALHVVEAHRKPKRQANELLQASGWETGGHSRHWWMMLFAELGLGMLVVFGIIGLYMLATQG